MKTKLRVQVEDFRIASKLSPFMIWSEGENRVLPPVERIRLCAALCIEEPIETLEAMGADRAIISEMKRLAAKAVESIDRNRVDLKGVADGLGDSDYVNDWARSEFGIDGEPIADEIHRANMDKFGPGSSFREDGKVQKPPGWTPPDIGGVLQAQGWDVPAQWIVAASKERNEWSLTTAYGFYRGQGSEALRVDADGNPMEIIYEFESKNYDEAKKVYEQVMEESRKISAG